MCAALPPPTAATGYPEWLKVDRVGWQSGVKEGHLTSGAGTSQFFIEDVLQHNSDKLTISMVHPQSCAYYACGEVRLRINATHTPARASTLRLCCSRHDPPPSPPRYYPHYASHASGPPHDGPVPSSWLHIMWSRILRFSHHLVRSGTRESVRVRSKAISTRTLVVQAANSARCLCLGPRPDAARHCLSRGNMTTIVANIHAATYTRPHCIALVLRHHHEHHY